MRFMPRKKMRKKRSKSTDLSYDIFNSPLGRLYLVFQGNSLCSLAFQKPDGIQREQRSINVCGSLYEKSLMERREPISGSQKKSGSRVAGGLSVSHSAGTLCRLFFPVIVSLSLTDRSGDILRALTSRDGCLIWNIT